jgi:predicted PurR-regulated permease PerM
VTVELRTRSRRATRSWRTFRDQLAAIAPQSVGRGLIVATVLGLALWLAVASWPSLAPYLVGGLIGYIILPVVNRLDSILPRALASVVTLIGFFALIGLFFAIVIPPLISSIGRLVDLIPPPGTVAGNLDDVRAWLASLPEPVAAMALRVFTDVIAALTAGLTGLGDGVTQFFVTQTLGILKTINFVLGLFVLPIWMTFFLSTQRVAKQSALGFLPAAARPDAHAVIQIVDRSAATYLRSQVMQAILTAVGVWMGLTVATALGYPVAPNGQVAIAALLGVLQLVPGIGFILGFLIVALVGLVGTALDAAILGTIYVGAQLLSGRIAASRIKGGVRDLHPVLFVPIMVALTQFGLIWLFLAAPLIGIVVDLSRYGYGRLGDPPAPAGVIPGQEITKSTPAARTTPPTAYRTIAAQR